MCQFKVTLKDAKPPIWRRIQVPETYSFWDLHVAIQDAMGWYDCHLHQFEFGNRNDRNNPKIGIPSEDDDMYGEKTLAGWEQKISKWFSTENTKADYWYDFGDDWHHEVKLEKILPCEKDINYPYCIAGKRSCPPEDCGGVYGYEDLLQIIKEPSHSEHESMLEWLGGEYDPEQFNIDDITFDNPNERLKMMREI
ncbi:plasmid pRiA4b ORF-3 family protein [bacterium]|nr:plasmid pRiA4b ORF-3 family protein [bacterium]